MKNAKTIAAIIGSVVVLAAHAARAQNVFAASNWNSHHLGATGVRLLLPPGTYVVNAKVSVHNLDSDPRPAVCRLSWSRLSEQLFRVDKWSVCRG